MIRAFHPFQSLLYGVIAVLAIVVHLVGTSAAHAAAEDGARSTPVFVKWSAGFDFSRGDYGLDKDTTLYYVPMSVTIDHQRFRAKIALPFLVSSGPTRIATGDVVLDSGQERGFGQLQVGGSYLFDPLAEGLPYVEVSTRVTAPTETRSALGTGLWAVAIQADLFKSFGRLTPFLSGGRKFYIECGQCNERLTHRFYTSVGTSWTVTEAASIGIAYDWLEAAREEASDSHEIVPYATYRLNQSWTIGPYAVLGLSDGSPDYGVGFSLSVRQ